MRLLNRSRSGGSSKKDDSSDDSDAQGIAPGTSSLISGMDQFSLDGESLALTAAMEQQREQKRKIVSMLSPNARQMLEPGYCHDIDLNSDCDEVSSMNDSIYFGGGASVAGFRGMPSSTITDEACRSPEPGVSPAKPIKLLGDDDEEADSLESGERFKNYEALDADFAKAQQRRMTDAGSASPNAGIVSESESEEDGHKKSKKYPTWVERAPCRLKVAIIVGIALLFAAAALGIMMYFNKSAENSSNVGSEEPKVTVTTDLPPAIAARISPAPTIAPSLAPVENPTLSPTEEPSSTPTEEPTASPTGSPSSPPSKSPTTEPTLSPTVSPTGFPTTSPVATPTTTAPTSGPTLEPSMILPAPVAILEEPLEENIMTVYLTTGHFSEDMLADVTDQLPELPNTQSTSIMVHLGGWNDPDRTSCSEDSYQSISELFGSSSVPVYFVVGEDDANNCPNQDQATKLWQEYLVGYETKNWNSPSWEIFRQGDLSKDYKNYHENFLFAHGLAAFVAIDLVGGSNEERKVSTRLQANLVWVETAYKYYRNKVDTIFILAHDGPPGSNSNNQDFYNDLFDDIEQQYSDMNFVLIHSTDSRQGLSEQYNSIENLDVASVAGPAWPPLRMTVDFSKNARTVSIQSNNKGWNNEDNSSKNNKDKGGKLIL